MRNLQRRTRKLCRRISSLLVELGNNSIADGARLTKGERLMTSRIVCRATIYLRVGDINPRRHTITLFAASTLSLYMQICERWHLLATVKEAADEN